MYRGFKDSKSLLANGASHPCRCGILHLDFHFGTMHPEASIMYTPALWHPDPKEPSWLNSYTLFLLSTQPHGLLWTSFISGKNCGKMEQTFSDPLTQLLLNTWNCHFSPSTAIHFFLEFHREDVQEHPLHLATPPLYWPHPFHLNAGPGFRRWGTQQYFSNAHRIINIASFLCSF